MLNLPPTFILEYITPYLPQQSLINLACTNFHFYTPCTTRLYKRLLISKDPILHTNRWENDDSSSRRAIDSADCAYTVISGYQHQFCFREGRSRVFLDETQLQVVEVKMQKLVASIEINPQLGKYVEEIVVLENAPIDLGGLSKVTRPRVVLAGPKSGVSCNLSHVTGAIISTPLQLANFTGTDLRIARAMDVGSLCIRNLTTLILPSSVASFWALASQIDFSAAQLETFRLVLHPEKGAWNKAIIESVNWASIRNLEIFLSTESMPWLDFIPTDLARLSIVQNDSNETHAQAETFDLKVFRFVQEVASHGNLRMLSIRHHLQPFGHFADGVEGNYLRRLKMYSVILPQILQSSTVLYLPNLFHSLANYEARVNVLLWNGCKCGHCMQYLADVDHFLMYHKHYNTKLGRGPGDGEWRDLNSSTFFTAVGNFLSSRVVNDDMLTALFPFPLLNTVWDMHSVPGRVPFRCYDTHVVDQGEFDEAETGKVEEVFFDTHESLVPCAANRAMGQGLARCVAHFFNTEVMTAMTNLYRGSAEEVDIGHWEFKDGASENGLRKLILNGIAYSLGKELNGTSYFVSLYD